MNKSFLKQHGYLYTTADILAAMVLAPGLGPQTKNFALVLEAVRNGHSVLEVLADPVNVAGVPANQVRYFKAFVESHKLSKRLYAPTRESVHVAVASIHHMERRGNKVFSTIDYSNAYNYRVVSESALSEVFASAPTDIEYFPKGRSSFTRRLRKMHDIFFVDLYVSRPEDSDDLDDETKELIQLSQEVMEHGFYYINEMGEEKHAVFLLQTPSQARTLQAIFIREDFMKPTDALALLGFHYLAFSKAKDGHYELDVTKMLKRPGLAGTNSIASKVISFGNRIVTHEEDPSLNKGEYRIEGGPFTMTVANDRKVIVCHGKYRIFNVETNQLEEFDAEEYPIEMTAADGAIFFDEELYHVIGAEFGKYVDACQVRITPFTKGLAVFVPGLREYYNSHVVAFKSSVKGDYRELFKINPDFKIEFRVAIFNKSLAQVKKYTDMPYQFVNASSLNHMDIMRILKPHLMRIKNAVEDPEIMKEYVGLNNVLSLDDLSDEEQHHVLETSKVSTFTTFLAHVPWSFEDVYMKRYAIDFLKQKLVAWKQGNVPVEGHYRYMIQDPYAVLEAGTKYHAYTDGGDLLIVNKPYHIQPMHAFMLGKDKDLFGQYVAAGRNPMIAKGEWQVLKVYGYGHYMKAVKRGAFRNLCVMSVHDFATFGMGGADNDGDTCLTVTEPIVVKSLLKKNATPILDMSFRYESGQRIDLGDGCPHAMEPENVYRVKPELVLTQNNYKITFTAAQAQNPQLFDEIHRLGIDYVIRTLIPNKIGFATNIATILADAIRGIGYMIAEKKDENGRPLSLAKEKQLFNEIAIYSYWIDLLRLIQGWEIDRAKHGGDYESKMAMVLDFMKNPPERLSKLAGKSGKRLWVKPDWLADRAGQEGVNRGSVLSRVRAYIEWFEQTYLVQAFEEMSKSVEKHSLLTKLTSAFVLDTNYFMQLTHMVGQIKKEFGLTVRKLHEQAERKKMYIQSHYQLAPHQLKDEFDVIDNELKDQLNHVYEEYRLKFFELSKTYPAAHLGFAAYYITYTDRKSNASLSFPWTVARECFLQALLYVDNKATQDRLMKDEVVINDAALAMCVPSELQNKGFTRERVAKAMLEYGAWLLADGDTFKVFVKGYEVGFLYNSRKNIQPLLGHDKYLLKVASTALSKGQHTVNLVATVIKK